VSDAADLGAAVVCRLVGADLAFIIVPESDGSTRFMYSGGCGISDEENEAGRGKVVVDTATEPSGTGLATLQRRMVFVPDARSSTLVLQAWLEEQDVASVLFLPLFGRPGVPAGVAIAGFHKSRRSVDGITTRGLNLLAETTGRVVDQLRQAEQLVRDADTDALTGLDNRRVFFRELITMVEGDAIVFLDLDHFKHLNDTLGHVAGDRELAAFGAVLREQIRESDIASRYGGEEFAVLVRGHGRTGAELLVRRLREAWDRCSSTTFSAGAALHEEGIQPSATLAAADRAVYVAKATGRDRMCWSDGPESFGGATRIGSFGLSGLNPRNRRGDDVASA
jgi:diguanylate cyclase (GGDEF)-like protein